MTGAASVDEGPNIAVVVLDTLRKDAFDKHFDWLPGRRYENAWAPSHWTVPVHGSLFTGKYASETGVHAKSPNFDYPGDALAELLSESGYTTRAYSSNVNITPQQNFDRGFDEFTGSWRLDAVGEDYFSWGGFSAKSDCSGLALYAEGVISCIRSDVKTLPSLKNGLITKLRDIDLNGALFDDGAKRAKEWISETEFGNEEFLFLNLMEAHSPYLPPRGYRTVQRVDVDSLRSYIDEPEVSRDIARQAYLDSVQYLSDIYEEIYELLDAQFDYIITVSDHGELLGEHGAWDHLYGLYPELTHVPLVVDGPEIDGESEQTVSLLDIHATVLELAGIDAESRGRSLLEEPNSEFWLTEYHGMTQMQVESLRDQGYEIESLDTELRGVAGPDDYYGYETEDGIVESGGMKTADSFQERVDQLEAEISRRDTETQDQNEELRSQLESLGYI